MEYKFGFADIEHEKIDEVTSMLAEYKIDKYIVGLEKVIGDTHVATNGEHMHFVLHVDPKTFKNWYYTLKNRYQLSGKNGKTGRYIGFMNDKKVRDQERFKAYSCKDKNVRWSGFTDEEINKLFEQSFEKEETMYQALMKHLVEGRFEMTIPYDPHTLDITRLEVAILRFHMEKEVKLCKSKLENYALSYMQLHMPDRFKYDDYIYHYMKNK